MISLSEEALDAIYNTAIDAGSWQTALEGLNETLRCSGAQMVVVDKSSGQLIRSELGSVGYDDTVLDGALEHVREWHMHDPHMSHTARLPVGVVMNTAISFPREKFQHHPFYKEYWNAYGVHTLLAAKLSEDDAELAMLAIARRHPRPPFDEGDLAQFEQYVRHVGRAYRIGRRLKKQTQQSVIGAALLDASQRPMFLLEATGRIVRTNAAADRLVRRGVAGLLSESGFLRHVDRKASEALARALDGGISTGVDLLPGMPGERRMALRLQKQGAATSVLLCSLWHLRPEATLGVFGSGPAVLLTAVDPSDTSSPDPMYIASMFNLTPAEARLAVALLSGQELATVAARFNVSLETVRVQLKSVFQKTNTNRQAALVSLLQRICIV